MSTEQELSLPETGAKESESRDWMRILAVTATVILIFFYTRSCGFPASLYWDLLSGRDFPSPNPWILSPERLSYLVAQSSSSLLGLKAIFHVMFLFLCGILTVWVFKGPEPVPGMVILGLFAFSLQPFLGLRDLVLCLIVAVLFTILAQGRFKGEFGVTLIPMTAAAVVFGLPGWIILALVLCHVLFDKGFGISLILCCLLGMLLFLDSSLTCFLGTPVLAKKFSIPEDTRMLSMLGGIFVIPNLITLPTIIEKNMAQLVFYAILGIAGLVDPSYFPLFIMVGALLLLSSLSRVEPLSIYGTLLGVGLLALVFHLFLFLSPSGFKLNTAVRDELGGLLKPLVTKEINHLEIRPHEVGEIAWKGLVTLEEEDFPTLEKTKNLWVVANTGKFDLQFKKPEENPPLQESPLPSSDQ